MTRADLVEVFEVDQRGDEWYALRLGVPTASCFGDILAGGEGQTRAKYMRLLAGERLSGIPSETYSNAAMLRGTEMEDEIRADHCFAHNLEARLVGFVRRTIRDPLFGDIIVGCSPDALIGDDGGLEIKSLRPDLMVELVESGRFPSEHVPQCQGCMWVTGRRWWDLVIGYRGMKFRRKWRIERDEKYIKMLADQVRKFSAELDRMVERVKQKAAYQ